MKTLLADLLPLARKDPSVTRRVCSNAVSCIQIHYLSILINMPSKDRFLLILSMSSYSLSTSVKEEKFGYIHFEIILTS